MYTFLFYFILFLIYSVIGWLIEVTNCSINEKKFVMRGFLIGPYCPIFGTVAILMILLLKKYIGDPIVLFIMATVIATVVEYATSYLLEKIFKIRWWDYSEKKYNVNGRVALTTSLMFGILGLALMYYINPFLVKVLESINHNTLIIIGILFLIMFIIDNICSIIIVFKIKKTITHVHKDYTEIIDKKVWAMIQKQSIFQKRLLDAFPNFKLLNNKKNPKK